MGSIKVSGLSIHPVKSLGVVPLDSVQIDHLGFSGDRRWMVVDETGVMRTQRQLPRMTLVHPVVTGSGIRLTAAGEDDLEINIPADSERSLVKVWSDECAAIDCGDAAAEWLSRFLGEPSRLSYFPENEMRQVDPAYANVGDRTAFSDGFPILLISQPSLDDLNSQLESPVMMQRFRPNLVVDGCEPYAEDSWQKIRIGDITLRVVKPCSRCVIPTIDLETGVKGAEPIKTLAGYRMRDSKIFFGQNVIAEGEGIIELGMDVEVLN